MRSFFGHPMLAYAVSAALHSGLFAEVVVSSDDPAIGRIAESYGAVFMLRPSELASDSAAACGHGSECPGCVAISGNGTGCDLPMHAQLSAGPQRRHPRALEHFQER